MKEEEEISMKRRPLLSWDDVEREKEFPIPQALLDAIAEEEEREQQH